ncbi:hypothetical protein TanjilG_25573 [Lupinus angustifolius]|uniref:Pectate lyase superfamily protein domain-containing protein n=1 Tax=Lupinus angustifolius TaxID=3871 RepID=A0A4P1QTE3_LUPAN|nr:hypothetical protein TanjilG_25573 [Lupinus angustifolius]
MSGMSIRGFTCMLLIAYLIWCSNFESCIAVRSKHWMHSRSTSLSEFKKKGKSYSNSHNHHGIGGSKPKPPTHKNTPTLPKAPPHKNTPSSPPIHKPKVGTPSTPPPKAYNRGKSTIFNVLHFGAKGDGNTDDTKAFKATWASSCKVEASTMLVPTDYVFYVGPISFSGPYCKPNIVFQALRFYGSFNTTVTGITIQNSPQCHLKFDNCNGVLVHNVSVSSPGDSPNTDGIHLQNSKNVVIHSSKLACGHGISIGSLGKDNTRACVSNITVRDVKMHNTMNGVRIKTWQTYGELRTPTVPPIGCLQIGKPSSNRVQTDHDSC